VDKKASRQLQPSANAADGFFHGVPACFARGSRSLLQFQDETANYQFSNKPSTPNRNTPPKT